MPRANLDFSEVDRHVFHNFDEALGAVRNQMNRFENAHLDTIYTVVTAPVPHDDPLDDFDSLQIEVMAFAKHIEIGRHHNDRTY